MSVSLEKRPVIPFIHKYVKQNLRNDSLIIFHEKTIELNSTNLKTNRDVGFFGILIKYICTSGICC